jgi:hypothetical protein
MQLLTTDYTDFTDVTDVQRASRRQSSSVVSVKSVVEFFSYCPDPISRAVGNECHSVSSAMALDSVRTYPISSRGRCQRLGEQACQKTGSSGISKKPRVRFSDQNAAYHPRNGSIFIDRRQPIGGFNLKVRLWTFARSYERTKVRKYESTKVRKYECQPRASWQWTRG